MIKFLFAAIAILCAETAFADQPGRYAFPDFESAWKPAEENIGIPAETEKKWDVPALPPKTGKITVLRFHAVTQSAGSDCENCLSITMDGAPILATLRNRPDGLPRLLNYSMDTFFSHPYFVENRLCLPSTGFKPEPGPDSGEVGWYVLDVTDRAVSYSDGAGKNSLVFRNSPSAAAKGDDQTILVSHLEAGYVSMEMAEALPPRRKPFEGKNDGVTPKDRPSIATKDFSAEICGEGGLLVKVGAETYAIESNFSHPLMKEDGWNRMICAEKPPENGEWQLSTQSQQDSVRIVGSGKFYKLVREISIEQNHILVKDTFTNLTKEPLGIVFENRVTPLAPPRGISLAGQYQKTYLPNNPENLPLNSTIFFQGRDSGLGIAALDDYYRLQIELRQEGRVGYFENQSFGLPPGDSYTFIWGVYPIRSSDYYDFINEVRKGEACHYPIEGSCCLMSYDIVLNTPKEKLADRLRDCAANIVVLCGPYGGGPWLGEDSNYIYKVPHFNLETYLQTLKKARSILKEIDPKIKCLAPFETALSPDAPAGDTKVPFPDSIAILASGLPAIYTGPSDEAGQKKYLETNAHQFISYPTETNSYFRFVKGRIDRALTEAEMDGIYFDIWPYTGGGAAWRWTYDRWDNRSVEMDLKTYKIKRQRADLCKLTEDARADLVQDILSRKKGNVVVVNGVGDAEKLRKLPIFAFYEAISDYTYSLTHLGTPISLGWTPGYGDGAKSIQKEGTWWQEWKTDRDYFEDIKDKLRSGCLYYTYGPPIDNHQTNLLTRPTILSRMFPITIEELHAGWIKGSERIITLHSGKYTWNDKSAARVYFYDQDGKESPGTWKTKANEDGSNAFEIEVPPDGAAVIEKEPPVKS